MKKKILFLIHDLYCGGAERVLVNLVNNLDQEKYDITIQTLFDVGMLRDRLNDNIHYIGGFKKVFRGNVTLTKLFTSNQLCKMLIKDDYDLVVSYLEGQCSRIVSAYNGKKIAWIHVESNSQEEITNNFRSYDETKNCYSKFDKIVCVAKTVEDNFNSYFHLEDKTEVIYNVIDKDAILEKSKEKQALINPNDDCFNIVSVGRLLIEHKGFDRLIRIHNKLNEEGIKNKLFIFGEGEGRKTLEELTNDDLVVLSGFVENPYKYVKDADLFVCPSYKEGYSTAVTEALILGIPVISTEVSGARELINNGCGVVCENDEQALYNAIKQALTNKALLEEYKQKAKSRSEQFSTAELVENCEKIFDEV